MEERAKFLEMVEEIKNIAKIQGGVLSKEDVRNYLGEMELSEEQWQAVYRYLGANHIKVEGYVFQPDAQMLQEMQDNASAHAAKSSGRSASGKKQSNGRASGRTEKNSRIYRMEVTALQQQNETVSEEDVLRFLQGDTSLRNRIIESRLEYVMKLSGKYKNRKMPREELIAEGNLGLLEGIRIIEADAGQYIREDGSADITAFWGTLELEAKHAVEQYIDAETGKKDWESAMLAKTNLLHEATKYMAEELGRIPTVQELSEYTHISGGEIVQIMGLSEDAARVANTDGDSPAQPAPQGRQTEVTDILRKRGRDS